ncbi:hypothetical protein GLU60_01380 [Nanohaloarchaea archaeon H01]|nr:hypothetical protein [Nanohaloarchaea archaeon H01]
MSEKPGFVTRKILPWFRTPDPDKKKGRPDWEYDKYEDKDDVWSNFHLFQNEWVEIQNRVDWYESPNVPQIYADHKAIFKQNMDMGRPDERYYEQNMDSNEFASKMMRTDDLPGGQGEMRIKIDLGTKTAPSGENDFAMIEYVVRTELKYDMPGGVTFLPRILAYPINRVLKWAFFQFIAEEMVDYDGEYARERTTEYFQYLRKYHGEEPTQTKSRQAEFKPVPEEGLFFQ